MKKCIAILLTLLMLFSLAACSANAPIESKDAAPETASPGRSGFSYDSDGGYPAETVAANDYDRGGAENSVDVSAGRKLIRKVHITAETEDYQAFVTALTGRIFELGGYVEDIEASTSGSSPCASITVRVPADRLSELTDSVAGIGNITYKHESQQDVTLQYVDTESQIAALRVEQDRLLELLDQADNLSDILEIEDRMTYVRYELESYERSLRALADQVDYATALIEVSQVAVFTPTEEVGFWEKIGTGLKNSLGDLWGLLKDVFSALVISLPYLLVFLVLPLIIVIRIVRRYARKKKAQSGEAGQAEKKAPENPGAEPPKDAE